MTQEHHVEDTVETTQFGSRAETMKMKRLQLKEKENKLVYYIASGLAVAVILVAGVAIFATHKNISIKHGDEVTAVSTWQKTPQAVLSEADIRLAAHTRIADDSASLSDGDTIVLEKAKNIAVKKDSKLVDIWTYSNSIDDLVKEMKGVSAVPVPGANTSELPAVADKNSVKVNIDGQTKTVKVADGQNIREAMAAAGIKVSPLDRVSVTTVAASHKGTAKPGETTAVKVERVERVVNEEEIVEEAPEEKQEDDNMYEGQTRVVEEGQDGLRIKRTFIEKVDGKPVYSQQLEDKVVNQAQKRVVKVGTKARPAAGGGGGGAFYAGEGVWGALAQCESGGNPRSVSSNGLYHGLYQFSTSTWHSVGGSGLPSEASPEEQTERAKILQARSGWGQWPACSRSIGVR